MAQFKTISTDEIYIPERLRAVEEEHALAIAQSIVEHGLINPITVRHTPNAKGGNYTLVAGAHRLRAYAINDEPEIEVVVVEANTSEAQLIEIVENIFRNELSVIDRAIHVQTYRDVWENTVGKIAAGRPGNRANITQLIADGADEAGGFSQHVAARMGVSVGAIKLLNRIAKNLRPEIRAAVRGTPVADNQSELLKIAKMEPSRQRQLATAFSQKGDLKQAYAEVDGAQPKAELTNEDKHNVALARLEKAWEQADEDACIVFLKGLLHAPDGILASFVQDHFDVEGERG